MTLRGVDVSEYQPFYKPAAADDFVIVKATLGTYFRNPFHAAQVQRARAARAVVGHYHFLKAGNVGQQVARFLGTSEIRDGDVLVCDWESSASSAEKDAFIQEVKRRRPRNRVLLYCNLNFWTTRDRGGYAGDGLWLAAYRSSKPGVKAKLLFWQYSTSNNTLDRDYGFFESKQALIDWAAVDPVVHPPSVKPNVTESAPTPAAGKPRISLKAVVAGFRAAGSGDPVPEVKAVQKKLRVSADGYAGPKTRRAMALYQVRISADPKPTPWPDNGWDAGDGTTDGKGDADGIPGRESLSRMGFEVFP